MLGRPGCLYVSQPTHHHHTSDVKRQSAAFLASGLLQWQPGSPFTAVLVGHIMALHAVHEHVHVLFLQASCVVCLGSG
jgi:hypothetical protein